MTDIRPLSITLGVLLGACTTHVPPSEQPSAMEAPVQHDPPPLPEELQVDAPTAEELRALADRLVLEEARTPGWVAIEDMPQIGGRRFFVYEDAHDLGFGPRCTPLLGRQDEANNPLLLTVRTRGEGGVRAFHEIIAAKTLTVTGGGIEQGTVIGGAQGLDFALVRGDGDHRVYASGVLRRRLHCGTESVSVACADGGRVHCSQSLPAIESVAATPAALVGSVASEPAETTGTCSVTCEPTECETVLGAPVHREIRRTYQADAAMVGIFRSRAACRAFASERAPLRPRVLAMRSECDCESCANSDDAECYAQCETACSDAHQATIDSTSVPPPRAPSPLIRASVSVVESPDSHQAVLRMLAGRYRTCLQEGAENANAPSEVYDRTMTWTIGRGGVVMDPLEGDSALDRLNLACAEPISAEVSAAISSAPLREGSLSLRVRAVVGASPTPAR